MLVRAIGLKSLGDTGLQFLGIIHNVRCNTLYLVVNAYNTSIV